MTDTRHIEEQENLWRRVVIQPQQMYRDPDTGAIRPSSAAFKGRELSVVLEDGRNPQEYIRDKFPNYGLAQINAKLARDLNQEVKLDPVPDEPMHALVLGDKPRPIARELSLQSQWIVQPDSILVSQIIR